MHFFAPVAKKKDTRFDHVQRVLDIYLVSEVLIELHEHPVFILNFQLFTVFLVADDELFGLVFQLSFKVVVFGYLPDSLDISLHYFIFLPNFRKSMPHFVEKIAKGNNSYDLNDDSDHLFFNIFGTNISITDGEHGGAGEVDGVDVLGEECFT